MSIQPAPAPKPAKNVVFIEVGDDEEVGLEPLNKSLVNILRTGGDETVERIAFEVDPSRVGDYGTLYYPKINAVPNAILKRISIRASIVAAIMQARAAHISAFGRPQTDRFSTGFRIEPKPGILDQLTDEQAAALQKRIDNATRLFLTCGKTTGWDDDDRLNLSQFLQQIVMDGLKVGQLAVEVIHTESVGGSKPEFHSFRPADAATIYRAKPQNPDDKHSQLDSTREQAFHLLEQVKNKRLVPERFMNNEYSWVQVIEGKPVQAFTSKEMLVHSLYPVTDIELGGYPLTPLDTVIGDVMTFMNISNHNKLYFQNGRAARGMLVLKSAEVSQDMVRRIRKEFAASINSTSNAWRMPVFGIMPEDEIAWQTLEGGSNRDMEFQYLSDTNSRVILSAFQMSPEELPGYAHLSRGTNNQALSECLDVTSRVITPQGLIALGDLISTDQKETPITVWDGVRWSDGRLFWSGKKHLRETILESGYSIKTSPDHRFLAVGEDGTPAWKRQEELSSGDWVLINAKPVEGVAEVPEYCGQPLTEEMMEVLGWMTGDGSVVAPRERAGAKMTLFYHHDKERDVQARHEQYMIDFGLLPSLQEKVRSEEEQEAFCERYGFNSVASSSIRTVLYDTDFVRWLFDLGFRPSKDGKVIPSFVHSLPVGHRQAFLRGFFSADGGKLNDTGSVAITIQDDILRDQTRQLLLGLGIRTLPAKGVNRAATFSKEKSFSYKLFIRDRRQFWDQIGFVQEHKSRPKKAEQWSNGTLPQPVALLGAKLCKEAPNWKSLSKSRRDNLNRFIKTNGESSLSFQLLLECMKVAGADIPSWMEDYHFERIERVVDHEQAVEMVDLEMYTESHSFVAEGFVVHNSNNEYKLNAARDVGFRPLLHNLQDFFNDRLLPLIDPKVAELCYFRFAGLDADTPEKETTRLQQDGTLHMTYNEILEKVEKEPLPAHLGGNFPLNPVIQQIIQNYVPFGEILEGFFGKEGAASKPENQWYQNPMWMNWYQIKQQEAMMQQQMQQQQAMAAQQQGAQGGEEEAQEEDGGEDLEKKEKTPISKKLPESRKALIVQHENTVKHIMDQWEEDSKKTLAKIMKEVTREAKVKKEPEDLQKMAMIHDLPPGASPVYVYRLEDDDGFGPYNTGGRKHGVKLPRRQPPERDFTPEEAALLKDTRLKGILKFGFETPEQATEWFGAETLQELAGAGYKLKKVPAMTAWRSKSGKQIMFVHPEYDPRKAEVVK